jgi:tetratricopeptide (TPR) repeat protein
VETENVNTLTRVTEMLAAHGVYALTAIFIFWQQSRAVANLQKASPGDHGYFRSVHTSVVIATYGLMAISTVVWVYATFFYVQRTYVKGLVIDLMDQRVSPQKPDDPPEVVQQITPESPDVDLYSSVKNREDASEEGKYDLAWILLPRENLTTLVFRFQHHYRVYARQVPVPSGTRPSGAFETKVIGKTFKVDLSKSYYTPGSSITLTYEPNRDDPVRKLGDIYLRGPNTERVKLPWEDGGAITQDIVPSPTVFSALKVYAASSGGKPVFGEHGEYDKHTARELREQLGSDDLKTQLSARRVLVQNGTRSFRFISDSLNALSENGDDHDLLIHNLAKAAEDIEAQGAPVPADINVRLGALFYDAHDYESSAHYFDKATDLPIDSWGLYFPRGYAYFQTGQFQKAIDSYKAYLAKVPPYFSQALAYTDIGICYERMGRYDDAEASYRKAMQIDPAYPNSYNALSFMLADRGERLTEALSLVEHALRLDAKDPHFKDTKGWVLYKLGDPQDGLALIKEARGAEPSDAAIQNHFSQLQSLVNPPAKKQ